MTLRRTGALLAVLAVSVLAPCVAARAEGGDISRMTVYDAGIAQFLEERTITLQAGTNTVEWRSLMPKAYLRTLRVVVEGAEVMRQDVTYDGADVQGQKSPVLHLVIDNKGAAGPRRVQVDYLAPGLKWENDYSLVLEPTTGGAPPTAALLDSWVSVYNSTGSDLTAGTVDLVAGELSLLVGDGDSDRSFAMQRQVANNVGFSDYNASSGGSGAEFGSLSAFTRFTLGRDIRMNANAPINRFPILQRARISLEERKVFESTYNQETLARGGFTLLPRGLEVRLVAKNTTSIPMPGGQVTVYARAGDTTQIAGQDRVALTPQGQEFTVSQGRSSTLFGTRRVLDRSEVDLGSIIRGRSQKLVTSVEVNLTNRGPVAAEAYVRENIEPYGDNKWEVTSSSTPNERLAANLLQFRVTVPAGGTTKVTYTVESHDVTPDAYAAFTERLRARLEADDRVVGLVALGSMAAIDYGPDAWSDHDFFVVTREGEQPAMRADPSWLPDAERLVLHFAETEHGVKALYDDGHLLEFAVFDDAELGLAKVNRYRVLFDRAEVARRIAEVREATVASNARGARDDAWLVGQFLTNLLVGVGRHRRGERLSGGLYAKSHAIGHLLTLLARHVAAPEADLLDDLDPFRRFERAFPERGAAIGAALLEETPAAAIALLDVAERALAGRVVLPAGAVAVVRRAAGE